MKTLATYSIKGGVGKTTAAVNLAAEAARSGARALLWDLDPQGAVSYFLRIHPSVKGGVERLVGTKGDLGRHVRATDVPGLHVVPADFSLRHLDLALEGAASPTERLGGLLAPLADRYDVAVLDCAPSISLASESVFGAADALLVPVIPATLSARTLAQLVGFLDGRADAPLVLPFLSMVDGRRKLHKELAADLTGGDHGFLSTAIPNASAVERMGTERSPLAAFARSSPAARAYRELWDEIAARLWT